MDPLYWVLIASLLVWGGLFLYLVSVQTRVDRLEQRLNSEDRE
jgi:CcmD family protein